MAVLTVPERPTQISDERKVSLRAMEAEIIALEDAERMKPGFNNVAFAQRILRDERYGRESIVVWNALEKAFFPQLSGQALPLLTTIYHALELHKGGRESAAIVMIPFLGVGGSSLARPFYISIGLDLVDVEFYAEMAQNKFTKLFSTGELTYNRK